MANVEFANRTKHLPTLLTPGAVMLATAVLLVLTIGWVLTMGHFTPLASSANGPHGALLCNNPRVFTVEVARDATDLQNALFLYPPNLSPQVIADVHLNTEMDCLFILLYWATLMSAATIALPVDRGLLHKLAIAGMVIVTLGAACDYLENFYIFRILAAASTGVVSNALATHVHRPSLIKWGSLGVGAVFIGLALLVAGIKFLPRKVLAIGAWVYAGLILLVAYGCLQRVVCWIGLRPSF